MFTLDCHWQLFRRAEDYGLTRCLRKISWNDRLYGAQNNRFHYS